ncbi:MAG: DNA polymerase III subunit beta [Calditerrivibrio sp.]|nr:DNA polymerase III subunit beta [Calditerrivibrio sp.]
MKATFKTKELLDKLSKITRAIPNKPKLPIAKYIQLDVNKYTNIIAWDTTNYSVSTIEAIEYDCKFTITIPLVRTILGLLWKQREKLVTIEVINDTTAHIYTDRSKTTVEIIDNSLFPVMPDVGNIDNIIEINQNELFNGLKKAINMVAKDGLRPVMEGILFDVKTNKITFVSSNSVCLSKYEASANSKKESEFVINKNTAKLLMDVVDKNKHDNLSIYYNEHYAVFSIGKNGVVEYLIIANLILGNYPNYQAVIPTDLLNRFEVNRERFIDAIKQIKYYTPENKLMKLKISKNYIELNAEDVERDIEQSVNIECKSNTECVIGFNCDYLLKVLNNYDSENIEFEFEGYYTNILSKEDKNLYMLLMQMIVDDYEGR